MLAKLIYKIFRDASYAFGGKDNTI